MRVFVTRLIPEAGLPLLRKEAEVDVWPGPEDETPSKEEIIHGIRKADVLLCLFTDLNIYYIISPSNSGQQILTSQESLKT